MYQRKWCVAVFNSSGGSSGVSQLTHLQQIIHYPSLGFYTVWIRWMAISVLYDMHVQFSKIIRIIHLNTDINRYVVLLGWLICVFIISGYPVVIQLHKLHSFKCQWHKYITMHTMRCLSSGIFVLIKQTMSLLQDTSNYGLCMHRECWERFPRHWLQRKPLVSDPDIHHAVMHVGIANPWWLGKRSRYNWRMRNPQFYLFSKRPY